MLPQSIFGLYVAALRVGGPVYSMVQSIPSCEQRELKKIKTFASLHAFLVYFLTCCCSPQGLGACLYHGAKHPFMQATQASKNFKIIVIFHIFHV